MQGGRVRDRPASGSDHWPEVVLQNGQIIGEVKLEKNLFCVQMTRYSAVAGTYFWELSLVSTIGRETLFLAWIIILGAEKW